MKRTNCRILNLIGVAFGTVCSLVPRDGNAQSAMQVLHNHVRPEVLSGQALRVGSLPPSQRLKLAVMLPLRNQSDLNGFLERIYDPPSSDYRHYLSVDEFTARFGPAAGDYQAIIDFANTQGFTMSDAARIASSWMLKVQWNRLSMPST